MVVVWASTSMLALLAAAALAPAAASSTATATAAVTTVTVPVPVPAAVQVDWAAAPAVTATAIPTYLDQVNPSMDRRSPMHDAAFGRMDKLGAKLVRYLHWSHSQAPFAELQEGVFNFTTMDEYVLDFMACKNAEDAVMNFDAGPCWLHEGADCGKPLRDATGVEYGQWISRIIGWYTKGGFTDQRSGKHYSSPHNFTWTNYEVLNEPNLNKYLRATPARAPSGNATKPVCHTGCAMVAVAGGDYFRGSYAVQKTILSQASCEAGCLANAACVQMTWAPKHTGTQCVFYDRIDATLVTPIVGDPVVAKVKCAGGTKSPAAQVRLKRPFLFFFFLVLNFLVKSEIIICQDRFGTDTQEQTR